LNPNFRDSAPVISRALGFILIFGLVFPSTASAAERVVERTFSVEPGCQLVIDTFRGGIVVEESDAAEVRLTVRLENSLGDEGESHRALDAVELEMSGESNRVSVRIRDPRIGRAHFVWHDRGQVELALLVRVPRRCSVDLKTVNGSITVGNLTGEMRARTDTGTILFRHIDGSVKAALMTGDILVGRCSGEVELTATRGNIRVGTIGGRAELKTANGDIDIQNAKGGLQAFVAAGDVVAGFGRGFTRDARIDTSGGSILVKLDPAAACVVEASSVWGHVDAAVAIAPDSGGQGKRKMLGRINGGGPMLKLRANGGHVRIEPGPALD
jgi:hypothetical protein